jgi:DNA anti-recombination protein RmuC
MKKHTRAQELDAQLNGGLDAEVNRLGVRIKHINEKLATLGAAEAYDITAKSEMLTETLGRLSATNIDEIVKRLDWLHDRVSLLANKLDNVRQQHKAIDGRLAQLGRLAYQVGQFSARLDRLEAPRRKRKPKPEPTPNGEAAA